MTDRPTNASNGSPSEIPGIYANETPTKAQSVGMARLWLDGFFAWFSEWIVLQY